MKKFTTILAAAIIAITCVIGLAACKSHTHDYGEWTVTTEATCTTAGIETRICKSDASHKETRAISAKGHDYGEWTVTTTATCETAGVETRICKHDATHKETRPIAALGHDWDEIVTIEATCETDGEMTFTCQVCGETRTEVIPALGHNFSKWETVTEVTCEDDGLLKRVCVICQEEEFEIIPALGHAYGDWTEPFERDGYFIRQAFCSNCGHIIEEILYSDGIEYDESDEGFIVTSYWGTSVNVILPAYKDGKPVIEIRWFAFHYSNLESIIIPETVVHIGEYAFDNCQYLTSITMHNGVTIVDSAFGNNSNLTDIFFSGTIEEWQNNDYLCFNSGLTVHCSDGAIIID
ncbi:MAG: leucine-rich repeat domain-containing protein [Firmicutes bacterium]|nr:leucine-rich repeat domain-containing protein [Bacillota bacterium]